MVIVGRSSIRRVQDVRVTTRRSAIAVRVEIRVRIEDDVMAGIIGNILLRIAFKLTDAAGIAIA